MFQIHKEEKEDSEKVVLQTLLWGHKPAACLSPLDDNLAYLVVTTSLVLFWWDLV